MQLTSKVLTFEGAERLCWEGEPGAEDGVEGRGGGGLEGMRGRGGLSSKVGEGQGDGMGEGVRPSALYSWPRTSERKKILDAGIYEQNLPSHVLNFLL